MEGFPSLVLSHGGRWPMGLTLPVELTEVLGWLDMDWPQADEEKLFAAAARWLAFARELRGATEPAVVAAAAVWSGNAGVAVDAFWEWWTADDGPGRRLPDDAVAAEIIGAVLHIFAGATLAMKLAFLAKLATLLVQVGTAVTTGVGVALIPVLIGATRQALRWLVKQIVRHVKTILRRLLEQARSLLKVHHRHRVRESLKRLGRMAQAIIPVEGAPKGLSRADSFIIGEWTNEQLDFMNHYLRAPHGFSAGQRAKYQAQADALSAALAKLPPRPSIGHRYIHSLPADVLARYEPGQLITEHAFTSTSRDTFAEWTQTAHGTMMASSPERIIMVVTGKNGRDVAPYSWYPNVKETLYDRGTDFMVTGKRWDDELGGWIINMDEVS
jgi:ADP-ribosyltransferase exoenzyme